MSTTIAGWTRGLAAAAGMTLTLALAACAAPLGARAPAGGAGDAPAAAPATGARPAPADTAAPAATARPDSAAADTAAFTPRLLLSWRAPYGAPRALETLTMACGDTTREDTLYLCMDPGRDAPRFLGYTATLAFHPSAPERLPAHWRFGRGVVGLRHLRVLTDPDSSRGVPSAFQAVGIAQHAADVDSATARVRLIHAVADFTAAPVRNGRVYLLARIAIPRPPRGDEACRAALCVEWVSGSLAFGPGDEPSVRRGDRFVSIGAPRSTVCAARAGSQGLPRWQPPAGVRR
jgi:hypothetical protein